VYKGNNNNSNCPTVSGGSASEDRTENAKNVCFLNYGAEGCSSVVQHLPNMHEALQKNNNDK
jgi:hypothetical protein